MKKITLISTLLLFICTSTSLYAGNNPGSQSKKIFKKISRQIDFPEASAQMGQADFVLVELTIGKGGELIVNETCGNPDLQAYVANQIEQIRVKPTDDIIGSTFCYKILFKGQK